MAAAASSRVAKPSSPDSMKRRMRSIPSGLEFGVMSTSTSPQETVRSLVPSASMAAMPPREAPTRTGGLPEFVADRHGVRAERGEGVVPVGGPIALTVATLVQGDGAPALLRHDLGRAAPGEAGLTPTVEEEHGPGVGIAAHVGHQMHAFEALKDRSFGVHGPHRHTFWAGAPMRRGSGSDGAGTGWPRRRAGVRFSGPSSWPDASPGRPCAPSWASSLAKMPVSSSGVAHPRFGIVEHGPPDQLLGHADGQGAVGGDRLGQAEGGIEELCRRHHPVDQPP